MKEVTIYTDGACSYNPGPGGFCAILIYNGREKVVSGGEKLTTNNRMELMAVIEGLQALKEKCQVSLFTDSAYVYNAVTNDWISSWMRNDWYNAANKPVSNVDLWLSLFSLLKRQCVTFNKVKGHADDEYNNRCDQIARNEVKKFLKED